MFASLKPVFYVQIAPDKLTIRNVRDGRTISEAPYVAIASRPKERILAVGSAAAAHKQSSGVIVINPFAHPRTLVSDFTVAEQLLKAFLARMQNSSLLRLAPKVVLHPLGEPAGGFTQVENRAFREMALGAGASEVVVWNGAVLSDNAILTGHFPPDGRVIS